MSIEIPYIEVQPDFEYILQQDETYISTTTLGKTISPSLQTNFWISAYGPEEADSHSKCHLSGQPVVNPFQCELKIEGKDFIVNCSNPYKLQIECLSLNVSCEMLAPRQTFSLHPLVKSQRGITDMNILSLDVTQNGQTGVTGSEEGSCNIWDTKNGEIKHTLQGHQGDVNVAQFFPSDQLIITAASDLRMKVIIYIIYSYLSCPKLCMSIYVYVYI